VTAGAFEQEVPAQADQSPSDLLHERSVAETIVDLWNALWNVKISIPEDTLRIYEGWIARTVDRSRDSGYAVVVSKLDRKLWLYKNGELEKEIDHIVVGPNPIDNKSVLGDGCTPEGIFYATIKNWESDLYKAVQISYPDTAAARRGLARRMISRGDYWQIVNAIAGKMRPPMYTPLGGDICIHGSRVSEGCIGIGEENMDYLFSRIEVARTPICIVRGTKPEYLVWRGVMRKVKKSRRLKEERM
jgi:hypothetical protein